MVAIGVITLLVAVGLPFLRVEFGVPDDRVLPSDDPARQVSEVLRTDFSSAEVDDAVVNLDRFPVFFPEKRTFFLQDADIFSFGGLNRNGIPFFSRRLGLDADRRPVDIAFALFVFGFYLGHQFWIFKKINHGHGHGF